MEKKNVRTKEEYVAHVKSSGKYRWVVGTQASTLARCKELLEKHRREWERYEPEVNYADVQYRHRTVTYTDWEVVE